MNGFPPTASNRCRSWLASLLLAAGCTSGDRLTAPPQPRSASLYVLNALHNVITNYSLGATGNSAPRSLIRGSGVNTLYAPGGTALDAAGRLYVANCCDEVLVFAAGASPNAMPIDAIGGLNTGLDHPTGIAFDHQGNLFVSNLVAGPRITAYAAGASGNAAPIATIAGANTRLSRPTGIAFDTSGRLYVANGYPAGQILIFAPGASGDVAPIDSIAGSNTDLHFPEWIALDAQSNLYVTNFNSGTALITVYGPGASGNTAPIRTITGSNTGLSDVNGTGGLTLDPEGKLYVANSGGNSITVFAAGATGNATPTATIQGSNTGLAEPDAIARDAGGKLYVVSSILARITVYAAGSGNVVPIATIEGEHRSAIFWDWGIARDAVGNLYVTNPDRDSVTVYAVGASGAASPLASFSTVGLTNQTGHPAGVAVDAAGNVYVSVGAGPGTNPKQHRTERPRGNRRGCRRHPLYPEQRWQQRIGLQRGRDRQRVSGCHDRWQPHGTQRAVRRGARRSGEPLRQQLWC